MGIQLRAVRLRPNGKKLTGPIGGSAVFLFELEQIENELKKVSSYVDRAQYLMAFRISEKTFKKYPSNRMAIYRFAVSLGDSKEWASSSQHKRNVKRAAALLMGLLKKSTGVDPRWVSVWKNEYYWFSKQPLKQWKVGTHRVKYFNNGGYYSMGVGAVSMSVNFLRNGNLSRSLAWAHRAIAAWENYFIHTPDYYNSYVWYAKALGLAGNLDEMDKALASAAKLAKRKITYREFRDARSEVISLVKKSAHPIFVMRR